MAVSQTNQVALLQFIHNLTISRKAFMQNELRGCFHAVSSTLTLLRALNLEGHQAPLMRPLEKLATALMDLEQGGAPKLLSPRARRGARGIPLNEQHIRAVAANAIDRLSELDPDSKGSEQRAAVEVGRVLRSRGFPINGRSDTAAWKAILNWRRNIANGQSRQQSTELYEAMSGQNPAARRDDLLGALGNMLDEYGWRRKS